MITIYNEATAISNLIETTTKIYYKIIHNNVHNEQKCYKREIYCTIPRLQEGNKVIRINLNVRIYRNI